MRNIKVRYLLKAKCADIAKRTVKERVYAEISCAFKHKLNQDAIYEKFQFSLECTVLPSHFGTIKENRGVYNYYYDKGATLEKNSKVTKAVRDKIALFETYLNSADSHFTNLALEPTPKDLKEYLMVASKRSARKIKETTYITDFIETETTRLYSLIGSGDIEELAPKTIANRATLGNIIKRYEKVKNIRLTFDNLNKSTYTDIWIILDNIAKGKIKIETYKRKIYKKKGLSKNTKKQYQTNLLHICRQAKLKDIEIGLNPDDRGLIIKVDPNATSEKTEAVLTENDILKVISYKSTSTNLELAKNYIIIASLMGMRHQTMTHTNGKKIETYSKDNVNFDFIHNYHDKTKTECHTPLFKKVHLILQKNENKFPDFTGLTLCNLNLNIRRVLKTIGIKNHQLYSTHNFRSTFVTNLVLLEVAEKNISYVTHPSKKKRTSSVHIYNRTKMSDKAKKFYKAVNKASRTNHSTLYTF